MAGTTEPLISNVSDTARWVATYRAIESRRPDALFHDPLAERMAGERGFAIVANAPWIMSNGWWMVTRTKLLDDYILSAIAQGCDRVLNLAAGLDTRPYRLDLPTDFTWIEADLPELLAEKQRLLADETPRCKLSRHAVDLSDAGIRKAFLDETLAGASKALVLTEGLVGYLEPADVEALSAAFTRPEIKWWAIDPISGSMLRRMQKSAGSMMSNAPFRFGPENGIAYFEDLGWTVLDVTTLMTAAARFRRLPWLLRLIAKLPAPDPRNPKNKPWSGVALLTR